MFLWLMGTLEEDDQLRRTSVEQSLDPDGTSQDALENRCVRFPPEGLKPLNGVKGSGAVWGIDRFKLYAAVARGNKHLNAGRLGELCLERTRGNRFGRTHEKLQFRRMSMIDESMKWGKAPPSADVYGDKI